METSTDKLQTITEEEWEKAKGVPCPVCGEPTLRLYPYGFMGRKRACKKCIERRIRLTDYKARVVGRGKKRSKR